MVDPKWTGHSFWFFPAQAIAITVEDFVIALGKRVSIQEALWTRVLGYVWTIAWFTYSTPIFLDWAVRAGLGRDKLTEWSALRALQSYVSDITGIDVKIWIVAQFPM